MANITGTRGLPDIKTLAAQACTLGQGLTLQDKNNRLQILVETGSGRTQIVILTAETIDGLHLGRLTTKVGAAKDLTGQRPLLALRMNATLKLGAFAVLGDDLVLKDTFLPAHTTAQELLNTVTYLAKTADQHEKNLGGKDEN